MSHSKNCRQVVWIEKNKEIGMASTITRPKPYRKRMGHFTQKCKVEEVPTEISSRVPRRSKRRVRKIPDRNVLRFIQNTIETIE